MVKVKDIIAIIYKKYARYFMVASFFICFFFEEKYIWTITKISFISFFIAYA